MNNKVEIEITGQDADILRKWKQQEKEIDKLNAKLEKLGRNGNRAGTKIKSGFDSALISFQKFGLEMVGIGSAVGAIAVGARLINEQHEALIKRLKDREAEGKTFGESVRDVRLAFQEDPTLLNKDLEREIRKQADSVNTEPKKFAQALIDTFSAKGDRSNKDAIMAQQAAFALQPNNLETGRVLAARALDLANAFGVNDMKANVGFMQNIQNTARLTDLEKVGSNLLPGIIGTTQYGDTPEQAAELGVTLSKLMTDAEGLNTRTALVAMAQQLEKFVPQKETKGDFAGQYRAKDEHGEFTIPEKQVTAYSAAKNTTERVQVMQKSPELNRAFLSGASFEKTAVKAAESLLKGTEVAIRQYTDTQKKILPLDTKQVETFNQKLRDIGGGEYQHLVTASEKSVSNVSSFRLSDKEGQILGAARNIFENTMSEVGAGPLETTLNDIASGTIDNLIGRNDIESYIRGLENTRFGKGKNEQSLIDDQIKELRILNEKFKAINPEPPSQPKNTITFKQLENLKGQLGNLKTEDRIPEDKYTANAPAAFRSTLRNLLFGKDKPRNVVTFEQLGFSSPKKQEEPQVEQGGPESYNRFQERPVFNAPAPATPGIPTSQNESASGLMSLMQQQVSIFGQILEEQKRQGRAPLAPPRPAPYKAPAERLSRRAG